MPFPKVAPFNPPTSKVPILGPSSGNPKSFQDPNDVANIGANIQAMTDQAKADTLYDAPPSKVEGYQNIPWIIQSSACRREGFQGDPYYGTITTAVFVTFILSLAICFHK